jgi:hypothetical protein
MKTEQRTCKFTGSVAGVGVGGVGAARLPAAEGEGADQPRGGCDGARSPAITKDLAAEALVWLGEAGAGRGAASFCAGTVRGGVTRSAGRDGNRMPGITRPLL